MSLHYRYLALDARLQRVAGQMVASSPAHLEQRLHARGLELICASQQRFRRPHRMSCAELADFCQQTGQLLAAGIPLLEALHHLAESGEGSQLPALAQRLGERITDGQSLSQAFAEEAIDAASIGLIRAGENTGQLADCLTAAAHNLSQRVTLAAQTRKVLLQPALAGIMVITSGLFLMVYLVPQIRIFLTDSGQSLPLASRLLFALADILQAHWPVLLALPLLLTSLTLLRRHPVMARHLDQVMLRLPLAGQIHRQLLIARLSEILGLLYASGVPLLEALHSLPSTIPNRAVAATLQRIAHGVEQGSSLAEAFNQHPLLPPLLIRMLDAGERSGTLEQSLRTIAQRCDHEANRRIDKLQALLGPLLTVFLGLLLGWIMLATIQPLYGLIDGVAL